MSAGAPRRRWALDIAAGVLLLAVALAAVWDFRRRAHAGEGGAGPGLSGRYFANVGFAGDPFFERIDRRLDFWAGNDHIFAEPGGISIEWTGTIWLPRGGAYKFGLEADQAAELSLDGVKLAEARLGGPLEVARKVLPAGPHPVTVRYVKGARAGLLRLTWLPPGRRGDMEYVPPSVLSPTSAAPPAAGRGAFRRDAALMWAVVLAALLFAGVLGRRGLRAASERIATHAETRAAAYAGLAVFALALLWRLWGLMDQGQTWDEDVYWSSGRNYLENLLAWDLREASWRWNFEHPPLTKYLAGLGALWADGFGPARAIFAALSAGTAVIAFALARRWFGLRAGVLAGITCALSPHLIGHGLVIGHETPSVFLWTAGVWMMWHALETRCWKALLAAGAIAGLAVSVRYPNGLLFGLYISLFVIHEVRRAPTTDDGTGRPRWRLGHWLALAAIPLVAAAVFALLWPRMWGAPLRHLSESWAKLQKTHGKELFLGRMTEHPGPAYFPLYLLVTAPLGVLLGALAFVALVARGARKHARAALALLAWLLVPFAMALSPVVQDGVRYILPALVPLAIAAGAGMAALGELLARRIPVAARWAGHAVGGAFALYLVVTAARIAPYYLDYYGEHVGGPRTVAARRWFETGWWGEGITGALDWVSARAPLGTRVGLHVTPNHFTWRRHDLWIEPLGPLDGDLLVQNHFAEAPLSAPGWTVVHEECAQGAVLVRVLARPGLDLAPYR
ncbi:MAG: glycosyltransferase family 39 protein [Deltaproteobacteria bacterium]|nr:glycosyltransferase family 39 protein [Deltaproteobacteria bacterium]